MVIYELEFGIYLLFGICYLPSCPADAGGEFVIYLLFFSKNGDKMKYSIFNIKYSMLNIPVVNDYGHLQENLIIVQMFILPCNSIVSIESSGKDKVKLAYSDKSELTSKTRIFAIVNRKFSIVNIKSKRGNIVKSSFRGASWNNSTTNLRVSDRNNAANPNANRNNNYGFRFSNTIIEKPDSSSLNPSRVNHRERRIYV